MKDDSNAVGSDAGWVDQVRFEPASASGLAGWAAGLGLPMDRRGSADRNGPLNPPNLLAYALVDPWSKVAGSPAAAWGPVPGTLPGAGHCREPGNRLPAEALVSKGGTEPSWAQITFLWKLARDG